MSNRRRTKAVPPEVVAFIASARTIGYAVSDRMLQGWAEMLEIGYLAPDCDDVMMVDALVEKGDFGDRDSISRLVDVGRICLIGGDRS